MYFLNSKLSRNFLLATIVLLLANTGCLGQDESDRYFDPYDICFKRIYDSYPYVFVGIVETVGKTGGPVGYYKDYRIKVTDKIIGNVPNQTTLTLSAPGDIYTPKKAGKYIFLANLTRYKDLINGDYQAAWWSKDLNDLPIEDARAIVKLLKKYNDRSRPLEIRGSILEILPNDDGIRYRFQKNNKELGFAEDAVKPLQPLKVKATHSSGKTLTTMTDKHGRFVFKNPEQGAYKISFDLPENYKVMAYNEFNKSFYENNPPRVVLTNRSQCEAIADYAVAPVGDLEANLFLENSVWLNHPFNVLRGVDRKSKKLLKDYSISTYRLEFEKGQNKMKIIARDVPAGEYVIQIYHWKSGMIYYPAVVDQMPTDSFSIKPGQTTFIDLTRSVK